MKRFLLFAGASYYPRGGWNDFQGDFDTLEEAQAKGPLCRDVYYAGDFPDWWQVIDSSSGEKVGGVE